MRRPRVASNGMRAGIYLRISRDREGREVGIDRQREDCSALADRLGWSVGGEYVDNDTSASTGKRRSNWEALLADLESGKVNAVVAYSASRMYRRVAELGRLIDLWRSHGIEIATVVSGEFNLGTAD